VTFFRVYGPAISSAAQKVPGLSINRSAGFQTGVLLTRSRRFGNRRSNK
jgi:hypothetical protein